MTNGKTVIHVLGLASPYGGNIIPSLIGLANELETKEIKTSFVFPYGAQNQEWCKKLKKHYNVYFIPQSQFSLKTVLELRKIFKKEKPVIIHTHHDYFDIPVTIAATRGSKVIWHYHNSTVLLSNNFLRKVKRKIQYKLIGKRARLISVSEHYRNLVINEGFTRNSTKTILNGISLARLEKNIELQSIQKRENIILAFGHPPMVKGTDILLAACEKLEKTGKDFELWLVFSESSDRNYINEKYKEELPSWLKLKPPVDDVAMYYNSSKIFVSASRSETFSYSVAEASYCGLPVISSDIPGLEWAHNLPSVKFFVSENIEELFDSIYSLLEFSNSLNHDLTKTQEIIEKNYSLQTWINQIINYYASVSRDLK